jgi:hypothetical protein
MGLDAYIYCDCYEKGRLLEPPPGGISLRVEANGELARERDDGTLESDLAFDRWQAKRACGHARGILLHHRLGNIALIGLLRTELQREPSRFPILLAQVVYSGSHGGDFLALETIPLLQRELESLKEFKGRTQEADNFMSKSRGQLSELATTALSIGKPIAF